MIHYRLILIVSVSLVFCIDVPAGGLCPVLDTNVSAHIDIALDYLNMDRSDLGFTKDVGKPWWALERVRKMLPDPLDLPGLADELRQAVVSTNKDSEWIFFSRLLELPEPGALPVERELPHDLSEKARRLSPALSKAISEVSRKMHAVAAIVKDAYGAISTDDLRYEAASYLGSVFNVEDHESVRKAMLSSGFDGDMVDRLIAQGRVLDQESLATQHVHFAVSIKIENLIQAARLMKNSMSELEIAVQFNTRWPEEPVSIEMEAGRIIIGSRHNDKYCEPALLIIDPGGADIYEGQAGSADATKGRWISAVLDLSGDDTYTGKNIVGPGSALFGVCALIDVEGNDTYRSEYAGQAAGLFGVAWLEDRSGNDFYQAHALAQGAGLVGIGILRDLGGSDVYDVGFYGQGFAGVRGIGILFDSDGNDRYIAGGRLPDYERHEDRYLSLAQGFSTGMRPYAGGGIGALVDLAGSDTYQADVFGQGASYWYSVGMLLDSQGNDTYNAYHYAQGTGVHMSMGLLADGDGNDSYSGYHLSQGSAHDYSVGMLLDHAGHDTYTSAQSSQGLGFFNSFGLLADGSGNDAYLARDPSTCQGIGHDGEHREYGSIGLLLDMEGFDRYSCSATNGSRFVRPNHGIVYDK